jgi:hypothetical protein
MATCQPVVVSPGAAGSPGHSHCFRVVASVPVTCLTSGFYLYTGMVSASKIRLRARAGPVLKICCNVGATGGFGCGIARLSSWKGRAVFVVIVGLDRIAGGAYGEAT